jgi:hypothetical protein
MMLRENHCAAWTWAWIFDGSPLVNWSNWFVQFGVWFGERGRGLSDPPMSILLAEWMPAQSSALSGWPLLTVSCYTECPRGDLSAPVPIAEGCSRRNGPEDQSSSFAYHIIFSF